jgi:hypothetical protein
MVGIKQDFIFIRNRQVEIKALCLLLIKDEIPQTPFAKGGFQDSSAQSQIHMVGSVVMSKRRIYTRPPLVAEIMPPVLLVVLTCSQLF